MKTCLSPDIHYCDTDIPVLPGKRIAKNLLLWQLHATGIRLNRVPFVFFVCMFFSKICDIKRAMTKGSMNFVQSYHTAVFSLE